MQMSRDDTPELCRKVWPKSTVRCHLVFHYDHNNRYATSSLAVIHISFCLHVRCFGATHCEIFSADLEEKMAELAHPIPQDEERTNPNCFIRIVYMALGTMFLSWEGSVCVCVCVCGKASADKAARAFITEWAWFSIHTAKVFCFTLLREQRPASVIDFYILMITKLKTKQELMLDQLYWA